MAKRITIYKPGGYKRLQLEAFTPKGPDASEVKVAVKAIGVNFADCIARMGLYKSAWVYSGYPLCPGFEVAGTISKLGKAVTGFAEGDRIIAMTRFNAYADTVAVPASQIVAMPSDLDFIQAASLPTVFLTAWYAACVLADVKPEQVVLVHSAAGGVGSMLVQLCKHRGCRVAGVVGHPEKISYVEAVGADTVIDRNQANFWPQVHEAASEGYDAVFDANGVATLKGSYDNLRAPGRLIVYGFHTMFPKGRGKPNPFSIGFKYLKTPKFNPLDLTVSNKSVMGFNLSFLFERPELLTPGLVFMSEGLAGGWLKIPRITTFPLANAAGAHRVLETGKTIGKLVLTVD